MQKPTYIFAKIKDGRPVLLVEVGGKDSWEARTALYIFLDGKGSCDNLRREDPATEKLYASMPLAEYERLPTGAFSYSGQPK